LLIQENQKPKTKSGTKNPTDPNNKRVEENCFHNAPGHS
jgi:hypothetical protein